MDFDAAGNLIATNYGEGTLDVFAPDGSLVRRIFLPFKKVSNLHFRALESTEVIVTEQESNALWSLDYGAAGQAQPGWV
jgi:sugar lactone lactonase YvrE